MSRVQGYLLTPIAIASMLKDRRLADVGIAASGATDAGIIEPNQDPAETIKKDRKGGNSLTFFEF